MKTTKFLIKFSCRKSNFIVFYLLLFFGSNVIAKTDLEKYQQLFEQQQEEFKKQQRIIAKQGKEIETLKKRLDALTPQSPIKKRRKTTRIISASKNNKLKLPSKPVGQAPPTIREKKHPPAIPRLNRSIGGVLTKKGKLIVEPSIEYAFNSNNRVFLDAFTFLPAIAIGLIDIREIKRHSLVGSLATRYGVTDRLELELRLPYVYRDDSQRSRAVSIGAGEDETFNAQGNDIGDIEFSARYQLNGAGTGWPIFVGNLITTIPTGTSPFEVDFVQSTPGAVFPTELPTGSGYFSFQPSITALYPTDPGVFFGNLSYSYNAETSENIGKVDPGDAIGLSFGMGFALNERSSFSLGYSHKHVFESEINGFTLEGSEVNIGQLLIGYSFRYSAKTNINLSLGIGTTEDAQDVRLNLRVPMSFDFLSEVKE